jgi:hypothetical protein
MAPSTSLLSAVAVLLGTMVVAQAASTPSLADLFHSKRVPYVSTASASASTHEDSYGYDGYEIDTKELCLQETEQKTCSWVSNCIAQDPLGIPPTADPAVPDAAGTPFCTTGQFWT